MKRLSGTHHHGRSASHRRSFLLHPLLRLRCSQALCVCRERVSRWSRWSRWGSGERRGGGERSAGGSWWLVVSCVASCRCAHEQSQPSQRERETVRRREGPERGTCKQISLHERSRLALGQLLRLARCCFAGLPIGSRRSIVRPEAQRKSCEARTVRCQSLEAAGRATGRSSESMRATVCSSELAMRRQELEEPM